MVLFFFNISDKDINISDKDIEWSSIDRIIISFNISKITIYKSAIGMEQSYIFLYR